MTITYVFTWRGPTPPDAEPLVTAARLNGFVEDFEFGAELWLRGTAAPELISLVKELESLGLRCERMKWS